MVDTHRKGSGWQRRVVVWLEEHGFGTSVRGIGYTGDDVIAQRSGLALSVECKNQREIRLARFVDQSVANAGDFVPVTVVHRVGRASVDDAYFVLRGKDFLRVLSLSSEATCNTSQHAATDEEEDPHGREVEQRPD